MANLKNDLDQYLLLQSDKKKTFDFKIPEVKLTKLQNIFTQNNETEANSWLNDTQASCFPKLSRLQRIVGFIISVGLGILCMILSLLYVPVLLLKTRKFVLLYTLGNTFFFLAFFFLFGFIGFFKILCNKSRIIISSAYLSLMFATLYSAVWLSSTPLTVLFAILQNIILGFMLISNIGGTSAIKFFGSLCKRGVLGNGGGGGGVLPI